MIFLIGWIIRKSIHTQNAVCQITHTCRSTKFYQTKILIPSLSILLLLFKLGSSCRFIDFSSTNRDPHSTSDSSDCNADCVRTVDDAPNSRRSTWLMLLQEKGKMKKCHLHDNKGLTKVGCAWEQFCHCKSKSTGYNQSLITSLVASCQASFWFSE